MLISVSFPFSPGSVGWQDIGPGGGKACREPAAAEKRTNHMHRRHRNGRNSVHKRERVVDGTDSTSTGDLTCEGMTQTLKRDNKTMRLQLNWSNRQKCRSINASFPNTTTADSSRIDGPTIRSLSTYFQQGLMDIAPWVASPHPLRQSDDKTTKGPLFASQHGMTFHNPSDPLRKKLRHSDSKGHFPGAPAHP